MFEVTIEEPVQDNFYQLRLDFDKMTFVYVYRRTAYEGGDGYYETTHRGSFAKESSGGSRRNSSGSRRGSAPSSSQSGSGKRPPNSPSSESSPRRPDPTAYFVCKVEVRDYASDWEPWDRRQAPERVLRKNDTFHQELLFRVVGSSEIVNENTGPACVMKIVAPDRDL